MTRDRKPRHRAAHALLLAVAALTGLAGAAAASDAALEITHIEPVGNLYTQIVAIEANGVRTLYVSGQVGRGETLEEQSRAAFATLAQRLEAAGAKPADVVKLVTYVVDWAYEKADAAFAGFYEMYEGVEGVPAHTLVGVAALYSPHALLEVEAVAVVEATAD